MSQTESAPDATGSASTAKTPTKPARNPIEKCLVWGVIAIGLVVIGIEARALLGYNMTLENISKKLLEVDESAEPDAALSMNDAHQIASFGPNISAIVEIPPAKLGDSRVWHSKLSWFSLAKTYELTLVMDGDQDGTQSVLRIETAEPPEEEEPATSPAPEGSEDEMPPGEGMGGFGGGEMTGGPGGGGGGGEGRGVRLPGVAGLMSNEAVAAELELSEEQQTQIASLTETLQAEGAGVGEILGQLREADESEQEKLREQLATLQTGLESKAKDALKEILHEEQMTRLQQINWQQSRESPLLTDEVAAFIALTDDQRTQLKGVSEELSAAMESAERSERRTIRETFNEKFLAVLTEEQQTQWTALLGEPFEMPAPTRGGGGSDSGRPQRPE